MNKKLEAKAHNQLKAQELFDGLDALKEKRKNWETTTYAASNTQLYGILADALSMVVQIKGKVALSRQLSEALTLRGFKRRTSTSLETQVSRWIFGECGHRIYTYSCVLSVACENQIDPLKLPQWIVANNGIENIRRSSSTDGNNKTNTDHFDCALVELEHLDALAEITASIDELSPNAKANHEYSVALVRTNSSGTKEIVYASNAPSTVRSVLVSAGKHLGKKHASSSVSKDLSQQAANLDAATDEAAGSAE